MCDSDSRWDHEFFAYQCHNVPIKRTTLHFFQNFANRTSTINRHRRVGPLALLAWTLTGEVKSSMAMRLKISVPRLSHWLDVYMEWCWWKKICRGIAHFRIAHSATREAQCFGGTCRRKTAYSRVPYVKTKLLMSEKKFCSPCRGIANSRIAHSTTQNLQTLLNLVTITILNLLVWKGISCQDPCRD